MTTDNDYTTNDNGIITSPGQFQEEPLYVPHFWGLALDGTGHEVGEGITRISISPEDRLRFKGLNSTDWVDLWIDGNGFVHCALVPMPPPIVVQKRADGCKASWTRDDSGNVSGAEEYEVLIEGERVALLNVLYQSNSSDGKPWADVDLIPRNAKWKANGLLFKGGGRAAVVTDVANVALDMRYVGEEAK